MHFFQAIVYYVFMMLSLTVLRKHASVGCVGGSISSLFMTRPTFKKLTTSTTMSTVYTVFFFYQWKEHKIIVYRK